MLQHKFLILFLGILIFLSGCQVNAERDKIIDIDFSNPPDRLSVETKNLHIYDATIDNLYSNKGGILISKPCDNWYVITQANPDSNSMDGTFDFGNSVIMCPIGSYQVKLGDIVEFKRPNSVRDITHRVIGMNATHYKIKGDNLDEVEDVEKQNVIAYAMGVIF